MSAATPQPSGAESWMDPGAGMKGDYNDNNGTLRLLIAISASISMYSAIELVTSVLLTFHRYRGCYFFSLLTAAAGILPYSLGFLLKYLRLIPGKLHMLPIVLLTLGWYPMVTGQSMVLWSRLHLVVHGAQGQKIVRATKWMIIANVFLLHLPTTVLTFGSNGSIQTEKFVEAYTVMEKIQMTGFFLQESLLSSIYIVETVRLLQTSLKPRTRSTMKHLIAINVFIITLDLLLLALECASLYILETLCKGIIYSIKLKLEFAILGKLVRFVSGSKEQRSLQEDPLRSVDLFSSRRSGSQDGAIHVNDFVDLSKVTSNMSYPAPPPTTRRGSQRDKSLDYGLARFEHNEGVSRLSEEELSSDGEDEDDAIAGAEEEQPSLAFR
ncbi:hypothetical protein K470DRAFT_273342 [Piedraia hortae CBS 480.64]|uniref:DUF7703 domain-containing protein n=1 Tax=Piedraia hortae CBS 480.64 TaxID=1314780 RepID=A0A6A7BQ49_9PEZI|nr:hypothetical protein K470DRAFT_273342 [Piedraia hortae CBS 480.64]